MVGAANRYTADTEGRFFPSSKCVIERRCRGWTNHLRRACACSEVNNKFNGGVSARRCYLSTDLWRSPPPGTRIQKRQIMVCSTTTAIASEWPLRSLSHCRNVGTSAHYRARQRILTHSLRQKRILRPSALLFTSAAALPSCRHSF